MENFIIYLPPILDLKIDLTEEQYGKKKLGLVRRK